ncbi:MAG: DMT family transporter [Ignavibacteriales bacterium]
MDYKDNRKLRKFIDCIHKNPGYIYLVLSFILAGATMCIGKWLLESMNPIQLNTYCAAIGFVITVGINLKLNKDRKKSPKKEQEIDIANLIFIALTGYILIAICYDTALWVMPVSQTIILYYLYPIFIFLACRLFIKKEDTSFSPAKIIGLLLAFSGAVLVATEGNFSLGLSSLNTFGIFFIGLSICIMVTYTIRVKKTEKEIPPLKFLFTGQLLALIIGPAILTYYHWWIMVNGVQIVCMIITAITYNAYSVLYLKATKLLPNQKLASWSYLEPVIAAGIAVVFLGESLGWYAIIGSFLVLVGIFIGYKEYTVEN